MDVWFVRVNGDTSHNEPGTPNYVPGEPPQYPKKDFNYYKECLQDGFARIGWPNSGPLRPGFESKRLAVNGYSLEKLEEDPRRNTRIREYLEQFASIRPGDIILIPAYTVPHDIYLGVVVKRDHQAGEESLDPRLHAYYYFHDIPNKAWYENAHRVDVRWDKTRIHHIEGWNWRLAFSPVKHNGARIAAEIARKSGLLGTS
jgi:hypothetical protein